MASYVEDIVQNIYTKCDMKGLDELNQGLQDAIWYSGELHKNLKDANQAQREGFDFHARAIERSKEAYKVESLRQKLDYQQARFRQRLAEQQEKIDERRQRRQDRYNKSLNNQNWLLRRAGRLFITWFGIRSLKNMFDTASRIQLVQKSIQGLTKDTQDWDYIQRQAFEKGVDLEVVAKGYRNFYSSARMAGFDKGGIQQMYSDMLLSTRAIGASTQQTEGALLALEQMLSKGRVSMEELRRQMGNAIPGAFEIGARAMNMTTAEFNNFVQKVGIASSEFVPKFIKQLKEEYAGGFKGISETLSFATTRLSVAWKLFQLRLFEGESGKNLAKAIDTIAKLIISPQFMKFAQVLGKIVELFAKLVSFSIKYIEYLPLMIGGIMLLTNSFKVLGKEGLLAFSKVAKASLVLYGRWLLLFGILAVLQDLIYGLFAPEMTDSLTENILRKLGVYKDDKDNTFNKEKVQQHDIRTTGIQNVGSGKDRGTVVWMDESGITHLIPGDKLSKHGVLPGTWYSLSEKDKDMYMKRYGTLAPYQQTPMGLVPLEKTDIKEFSMGDVKIYVLGNKDPEATAESVVDKFDTYRRSLTPLADAYNW